jgi:uncharacterized protein YsxB (DUF464 family)
MIVVTLSGKKSCMCLEVSGHSESSRKGNDVICAAVSGMAQMLEIGLNQVLNLKKKP